VWHRGDHPPRTGIVRDGVGGKDKEFLSFINRKREMRVATWYFGH